MSCCGFLKHIYQQLLGVAMSPSCMPRPYLNIKVVDSFSGCWWLTFMATVLSIAVFILTQEEHTRTQNGATVIIKSFVLAPTKCMAILLPQRGGQWAEHNHCPLAAYNIPKAICYYQNLLCNFQVSHCIKQWGKQAGIKGVQAIERLHVKSSFLPLTSFCGYEGQNVYRLIF